MARLVSRTMVSVRHALRPLAGAGRRARFAAWAARLDLELWAGGTNLLEAGDGTTFARATRVRLRSGAIRLGRGTHIRDFVNVKSLGELVLGDFAILGHGTTVHAERRVELETMVGLAEYVTVIDSDHKADGSTDVHFTAQPLRVAPVHNTFVAAHSTLLKGTRIGAGSVVGAGAGLTGGEYPGGSLIAGTPARVIRALGAEAVRS